MSTTPDASAVGDLDFDESVRPQDDLFRHVNANWIARTEIPEDRATHGSFAILNDVAEEQVRTIIEEAAETVGNDDADPDAQRIGALYASFSDTATVNVRGAEPLAPLWARVAAAADTDGLMALMGQLTREGVGGVVSVSPWIDRGNPERFLLHLGQSGLGLPDESYYRLDEHAGVREAYEAHIGRMLSLAVDAGLELPGGGHPDQVAEDVMALETRMASAHWERADTRDAVKTYNLLTSDELTDVFPASPAWFGGMGLDAGEWAEVVVGQPDVLEALTKELASTGLATWKRWLAWKVLRGLAPYLSDAFVDERFDFYGRTLTGAQTLRERWKRGVSLVESVVGEAVGRLYVARHYPPRAEAAMAELVDNLLAAYEERITNLDWMAAETRTEALAKLATFTPKVGRPKKWRDYSGLELDADDLVGNVAKASAFEFAYQVGKLSRPVDRDEWLMTPQTVNAYYNPALNEIVFPAAILQPPFFDADGDPAYNYGGIGAVIGHEIGHGFDDQGSRYDGNGSLRDWWTQGDRERFEQRAQALIEQFDVLTPRGLDPAHTVNGKLTVGENIGDLGGVAVAHYAYRLSLGGEEAPIIDGLTGDQRFFIGWARAWRVVSRTEEAIRRLAVDPHSPPEFRVNMVRNIDAFHEAFGTTPDDGLWLDPAERVAIW